VKKAVTSGISRESGLPSGAIATPAYDGSTGGDELHQ